MKSIILILTVILLSAVLNLTTAQPWPPSKSRQARVLKKTLQLDDSQLEKVKVILKDSDIKLTALKEKMEDVHEQEMNEMDKILADQKKQITNILNASQKEKFEKFNDEHEMRISEERIGPHMRGKENMPGHGMDYRSGFDRNNPEPMNDDLDFIFEE